MRRRAMVLILWCVTLAAAPAGGVLASGEPEAAPVEATPEALVEPAPPAVPDAPMESIEPAAQSEPSDEPAVAAPAPAPAPDDPGAPGEDAAAGDDAARAGDAAEDDDAAGGGDAAAVPDGAPTAPQDVVVPPVVSDASAPAPRTGATADVPAAAPATERASGAPRRTAARSGRRTEAARPLGAVEAPFAALAQLEEPADEEPVPLECGTVHTCTTTVNVDDQRNAVVTVVVCDGPDCVTTTETLAGPTCPADAVTCDITGPTCIVKPDGSGADCEWNRKATFPPDPCPNPPVCTIRQPLEQTLTAAVAGVAPARKKVVVDTPPPGPGSGTAVDETPKPQPTPGEQAGQEAPQSAGTPSDVPQPGPDVEVVPVSHTGTPVEPDDDAADAPRAGRADRDAAGRAGGPRSMGGERRARATAGAARAKIRSSAARRAARLASTGADLQGLAVAGFVLLAGGLALGRRAGRR
jgi:hypothetical protein